MVNIKINGKAGQISSAPTESPEVGNLNLVALT